MIVVVRFSTEEPNAVWLLRVVSRVRVAGRSRRCFEAAFPAFVPACVASGEPRKPENPLLRNATFWLHSRLVGAGSRKRHFYLNPARVSPFRHRKTAFPPGRFSVYDVSCPGWRRAPLETPKLFSRLFQTSPNIWVRIFISLPCWAPPWCQRQPPNASDVLLTCFCPSVPLGLVQASHHLLQGQPRGK